MASGNPLDRYREKNKATMDYFTEVALEVVGVIKRHAKISCVVWGWDSLVSDFLEHLDDPAFDVAQEKIYADLEFTLEERGSMTGTMLDVVSRIVLGRHQAEIADSAWLKAPLTEEEKAALDRGGWNKENLRPF